MAKRFSELGVKIPNERKIFDCEKVSITDIINTEIEVHDYLPEVKTSLGEGRYLVHCRLIAENKFVKFFTTAQNIKAALDLISKEDFPFVATIKAAKCGSGKFYKFT